MASELRDLSRQPLKLRILNMSTQLLCLEKKLSTCQCRDLARKSALQNRKPTNFQANLGFKTSQRDTCTCSLPYKRGTNTCNTCYLCTFLANIHLDLSEQHYTCCTSPRSHTNLHSKLHVRHLKLTLVTHN